MSTDVIGFTEPIVVTDTTTKKPHKPLPPRDTTSNDRVPIGFNPSVEDWEESDTVDINI